MGHPSPESGNTNVFLLIGGGYIVPALPDLFDYIFQMIDIVEKEGKSVACLFLSYGMLLLLTIASFYIDFSVLNSH